MGGIGSIPVTSIEANDQVHIGGKNMIANPTLSVDTSNWSINGTISRTYTSNGIKLTGDGYFYQTVSGLTNTGSYMAIVKVSSVSGTVTMTMGNAYDDSSLGTETLSAGWIAFRFTAGATNVISFKGSSSSDYVEIGPVEVREQIDVIITGQIRDAEVEMDGNVSGDLTVYDATASKPDVTIKNTNADANGANLIIQKDSASPANADALGNIIFKGDDDGGTATTFAQVAVTSEDVSDATEDGKVDIKVQKAGTLTSSLTVESGDVTVPAGDLTVSAGSISAASSTTDKPDLTLTNTNADATGADIILVKDSASPANSDVLGNIIFKGDDDGGTATSFAQIIATSEDVTNATEDGKVDIKVQKAGTLTSSLTIESGDVTVPAGDLAVSAGSVTATSATSSKPDVVITNTNTNSNGPAITLAKDSASPANSDEMGNIIFEGDDDGGTATSFAQITATSEDVTDGSEDGKLDFQVMKAGALTSSLAIESGAVTIPAGDVTVSGGNVEVSSASASSPQISVKNTEAGATAGSIILQKDSASPANDDTLGTLSYVGDDDGGNATTFGAIICQSTDVTDATEDGKFDIKVQKAGTLTSSLTVESGDVTVPAGDLAVSAGNITAISSSTSRPDLLLSNTNADASSARVTLQKNSASPAASDQVGEILFEGKDDGAAYDYYAKIIVTAEDVTAASEDGKINFKVIAAGSDTSIMTLDASGATLAAGDLAVSAGSITAASSTTDKPDLTLTNTNADATGADIILAKDSASPANSDVLGNIIFKGDDDGGNVTSFATIIATSEDVADASEDGKINFKVMAAGSDTSIATIDASGVNIASGALLVSGTQVVGAQGSAVSDAATQDITGSDTVDKTKVTADLTSCKNAINTILDRLQAHGLIAT